MSSELRKNLLKYGITTLAGVLSVFGVLRIEGFSSALAEADRFRILCDAFITPGILLILFGALVWLSSEGAMDGVSWAMINFVKSIIPGMGSRKESYGDYVERRHSGGKAKGYGFLIRVGAVFAVIGFVFLFLFFKAEGPV